MSGFDNILSKQILDLYDDAIRGVINSLKIDCVLYNPVTLWQDCSCDDSVFNNSPNPFIKGKLTTACSVCGGNQKVPSETTVELKLCVIFDYKKFNKLANGIVLESKGDAQTLCEIAELQQIKQSKYIVLDSNTESLKTRKFKIAEEPTPMGFRNNFYSVIWEEI